MKNLDFIFIPTLSLRSFTKPDLSRRNFVKPDLSRRSFTKPDLSRRNFVKPELSRRSPKDEDGPVQRSHFNDENGTLIIPFISVCCLNLD